MHSESSGAVGVHECARHAHRVSQCWGDHSRVCSGVQEGFELSSTLRYAVLFGVYCVYSVLCCYSLLYCPII
jgi:hypothetical protein